MSAIDPAVRRSLVSTHEVISTYSQPHGAVTVGQLRALVADLSGVDGDTAVTVRVANTHDHERTNALAITVRHEIEERLS